MAPTGIMNSISRIKPYNLITAFFICVISLAAAFNSHAAAAQDVRQLVVSNVNDEIDSNYKNCVVVQKSYALIATYWKSLDVLNQIKDPAYENCEGLQESYKKLCDSMQCQAAEISNYILEEMTSSDKDIRALKMFSALYKSKAVCDRQPLYFVCTPIIKKVEYLLLNAPEKFKIDMLEISSVDDFEKQYFPGYGEADPQYYYRLGRELSSEITDSYWKEISTTHTQYDSVESEVSREHLFSMYDDPDIDIMEQQGPYEKIVDGVPMQCYKVRFMVLATITTVSKRKYDLNRVWFELLRNKYSILMPSKWEVCGKTYEMHEFYTGNEVILKQVK